MTSNIYIHIYEIIFRHNDKLNIYKLIDRLIMLYTLYANTFKDIFLSK